MVNSVRHRPSGRRYTIPVRVEPRRVAPTESPPLVPEDESPPPRQPVRTAAPDPSEREDWQDRALRLQADMDNYRKRQRRIAQEQAQADRDRLLTEVLSVADNLDRALATAAEPTPVRQGVLLARDELLRLLKGYEVERLDVQGRPFDPHWHQAVAVVPAGERGVMPGTVVRVERAGYRRGERLLRPAHVVVAQ